MITPERRTVELESVRDETHDVKTFTFSTDYDFEPGQFVNLRFSDDDAIGRRSFSVASAPGARLEITVKAIGTFTNALFAAELGTRFEILGPLGLPYIRGDRDEPRLIIAGGTGIAPFRSLMLDPTMHEIRFTIVDSNKTEGDIVYRDEMGTWPAKIVHTLTRETRDGYRHGRIDAELLSGIADIASHRALVCGPAGLVSRAIELLTSLGVPMERIKTESWGN